MPVCHGMGMPQEAPSERETLVSVTPVSRLDGLSG